MKPPGAVFLLFALSNLNLFPMIYVIIDERFKWFKQRCGLIMKGKVLQRKETTKNGGTTMNDESESRQESESCQTSVVNYTVDSFANGIAFGQHKLESGADPRDFYSLRMRDDSEMMKLRSRYILHKNNPLHELELSLMRLSRQGVLHRAHIYFGVTTDPFHPFEDKFDASMKFLKLFERYTPGMLVIQTRSPLLVLALPVLRQLGSHVAVTMGIETPLEEMARLYTPGLPRISERFRTVEALRKLGVEVSLQVSPVIPYGDWRKDAASFARTLADNGDYVYVRSITDGSEGIERKLRSSDVARRLARDRLFHYLRHDSANPLISALEEIAPEKLRVPTRENLRSHQMEFFAA